MPSIHTVNIRARRVPRAVTASSVRVARTVPHVWSKGMYGVVETPYGRSHFVVDEVTTTHLRGTTVHLGPTGEIKTLVTFEVVYPLAEPTPTTWEQIVEDHALDEARASLRIRSLGGDCVTARIGRLATRYGVVDLAPVAGSDAARLLASVERSLGVAPDGTVGTRVDALERLAA